MLIFTYIQHMTEMEWTQSVKSPINYLKCIKIPKLISLGSQVAKPFQVETLSIKDLGIYQKHLDMTLKWEVSDTMIRRLDGISEI